MYAPTPSNTVNGFGVSERGKDKYFLSYKEED